MSRTTLRSTLLPYTTLFRSERRTTTAMAQLLITHAQSNSTPITHAPTTIALSRSRPKETRPVLKPTSRLPRDSIRDRSEEHTSELQSLRHLVCRLLLEKKKK